MEPIAEDELCNSLGRSREGSTRKNLPFGADELLGEL